MKRINTNQTLLVGAALASAFAARGNKKMEAKMPELERDIRALAEPHSQADPPFKSSLAYARLSAASVRRALAEEKGWREEDPPAERTMNAILNRHDILITPSAG
jgi:hypothetical protein